MPGLFNHIRKSASEMAYGSFLYNWSLRGNVPERLIVRPVDPWGGDSEAGRILCEGALPEGYAGRSLHEFLFLRDLRAFAHGGGNASQARAQARVMIESWILHHGMRWEAGAWDAGTAGMRLAMWISHYEFFVQFSDVAREEDHEFQDLFYESLARQAAHLSKVLMRDEGAGLEALRAVQGLLYAGLAIEGREAYVEQALACFKRQIAEQFLSDGGHRSRNPVTLMKALKVCLDIRGALQAGGYPLPEILTHTIEKAGQALCFFRYADKRLAVFNGAQEGALDDIDAVVSQAGVRGKTPQSLAKSGYEKVQMGRTCLMMDCGRPPLAPYDAAAHAAPLAFEMSHGRERLFVNCGSHSTHEGWRDSLRATPAHNTLSLADRNVCEVMDDGHFGRFPRKVSSRREEHAARVLIEGNHDGYEALNGFTHNRRIYVTNDGYDVQGEDSLTGRVMPDGSIDVAVRFHLHPRVMVSLIRDGAEALLRLPGGAGWRFYFSGAGKLALEDSVYLGEGNEPRKTKQLIIYGQIFDKKYKILWGVQKEG